MDQFSEQFIESHKFEDKLTEIYETLNNDNYNFNQINH